MPTPLIRRRAFLRGLGATGLLLPFFPALDALAAQGMAPKRFVVFKFSEGVEKSTWFPTSSADLITPALQSLRPWASQLSIVRGIKNESARDHTMKAYPYPSVRNNNDFHDVAQIHLLTGGRGTATTIGGFDLAPGESIDRLVGRKLQSTPDYVTPPQLLGTAPSYNLGINSKLTSGLGAYADTCSCISYPGWGQYLFSQDDPLVSFQELLGHVDFGDGTPDPTAQATRRRLELGASMLDDLRQDARQVRCTLGVDGRQKFDAYIQGVRDIEAQITAQLNSTKMTAKQVPEVLGLAKFDDDGQWRSERHHDKIAKIQMDIAVSALIADARRALTLSFSHTLSNVRFRADALIPGMEIDADHHGIAHENRGDVGASVRDKRRIDTFHAEKLAYFVGRLANVPEGDGTMLDNTLILCCSEMGYGTHEYKDLPIMLLGAKDRFKHGQFLDYAADQRPMNDVLTAILQGFDLPAATVGNPAFNRAPLTELLR